MKFTVTSVAKVDGGFLVTATRDNFNHGDGSTQVWQCFIPDSAGIPEFSSDGAKATDAAATPAPPAGDPSVSPSPEFAESHGNSILE